MSEWNFIQIGKLGKVVTGKTPSKNNPEQWGEEALFVTPSDMTSDGKYITSTVRRISKEGLQKFKNILLPINSVMVSCIGSDMGKVTINEEVGITNQQINSIIVDQEKFDTDLVYYSLKHNYQLLKKFADGGSTMPILNKSTFESLELFIPKEKESQKQYSSILKLLDNKITLLRQQNQTLEELAQTLFKRWFVEFEFPFDFAQGKPDENGRPYKSSGGKMVESELGEIPEGWRVGEVSDHVKHITTSVSPAKEPEKEFSHYSIPAFDDGRFPTADLGASILSNKYVVKEKSILVSKLNPSTSRIWPVIIPKENAICSTEIQVFIPEKNRYLFSFGLFHDIGVKKEMAQRAAGTSSSHQRVRPSDILNITCIVPENRSLEAFERACFNLLKKSEENQDEIQSLTQLRDTLLPKLMSGEVRVNI